MFFVSRPAALVFLFVCFVWFSLFLSFSLKGLLRANDATILPPSVFGVWAFRRSPLSPLEIGAL
jgi:hypothetical protein